MYVDKFKCSKCLKCVEFCPNRCIMFSNALGIIVDNDNCTDCMECDKYCDSNCITKGKRQK